MSASHYRVFVTKVLLFSAAEKVSENCTQNYSVFVFLGPAEVCKPPMSTNPPMPYVPKHAIRIVTAGSLFDGHDAAINIMRRILQASGAEVIHLGHNRSAESVVRAVVQEDAAGVAITSYQGGHVEYFSFIRELLGKAGSTAKLFGGGGGTILPSEAKLLHERGITRIYSPDDGRAMGLQGMINHLLSLCDVNPVDTDYAVTENFLQGLSAKDGLAIGRGITWLEHTPSVPDILASAQPGEGLVLGVTGTGGAGKSSLVDELLRRFLGDYPDKRIAIISIDPSKRKTGGALLGDRIRMNSIETDRVYMRSLATRGANLSVSVHAKAAVRLCQRVGFDLVVVETSGIGQSNTEVTELSDVSLYVMTPEYGAASQLEKIDMLDFADFVAINKFDKRGAKDALRDVRRQVKRNRGAWAETDDGMPIFGTIAARFGDVGVDRLFYGITGALAGKDQRWKKQDVSTIAVPPEALSQPIVSGNKARYLADIAENSRTQDAKGRTYAQTIRKMYHLAGVIGDRLGGARVTPLQDLSGIVETQSAVSQPQGSGTQLVTQLVAEYQQLLESLPSEVTSLFFGWVEMSEKYRQKELVFSVRGTERRQPLVEESLSGLNVRRISLPKYSDWGDLYLWLTAENLPGVFPFTAGVFPLKRKGELPARMFAGEGDAERTNRRFHYLSSGQPAKRLSTAFDSVTLYGEDPSSRMDIYGKIGNSGVSVATLDDAKKLYSGFDLCDPATSVSMTINGPAPMVLAFFLNAAVDQQCEKHLRETGRLDQVPSPPKDVAYYGDLPKGHNGLGLRLLGVTGDSVVPQQEYERIRADTLAKVRGTVQADILKEDQAQNTCIFSAEFALHMMGDVQQYFIDHRVRNFYSVSISGYHIAEAGANPITQLAFTLSNGFTFVEYYLSRGMAIDDFARNLSFFFSNGLDPEYTVIGRVARRIWAKAMRYRYGANARSQKLKYHIQTSGRSLHAQEIAFNDIRTTLQALVALNDHCNSLHTNAYDEAITTPTEESVRRAMAIQLIINKEFGQSKNENSLQGSFFVEELTDLVEEAVLQEFERISDRGGVLGAMERMYQRTKIQEESMLYESKKHTGELPIVGVNTYLDDKGSPTTLPKEIIRSTEEEKKRAIAQVESFRNRNKSQAEVALQTLRSAALSGANTFTALMETSKVATLGQMSASLYKVGGQYRRSM